MSAISEINKVWIQKFPGSSLPEAWAEDVKTNLSKHKKRVLELEEELEQEKIYVEFLESLLAEVQSGSSSSQAPPPEQGSNGTGTIQDMDDIIKDTLERRSLAAHFPAQESPEQTPPSKSHREVAKEDKEQRIESPVEKMEEPEESSLVPQEAAGGAQDDRDHFVTVIEVNGFDKKNNSNRQASSSEDSKRLTKKVPPRPPPKVFKRQEAQPPQSNESESAENPTQQPSKTKENRPVVFDSRKLSGAALEELSATSAEYSTKTPSSALQLKKFEGSKHPLPTQTSLEEKPTQRSNGFLGREVKEARSSSLVDDLPVVRSSKILDLVNRMESTNKMVGLNKSSEEFTPRRSFRKQFQGPVYHSIPSPADPNLSDYVDPCDAEFDVTTNDQIYDSPPPEEDLPLELTETAAGSRLKTSTLDTANENLLLDPDSEPMYDTVAPDQDDDYVLLLEEGNQTTSSSNSLSKKETENSAYNNDVATIKSQTSVMSGHSVGTTSSGTTSETEGITGSPLPHDISHKNSSANYVNIDYFLSKPGRKDSAQSLESEDDDDPSSSGSLQTDSSTDRHGTPIDFSIDSGVFGGASELAGMFDAVITPPGSARRGRGASSEATTMTAADQEKLSRFRYLLSNIAEREGSYVEVLNVLLQYMKALKATLSTSRPVLCQDEFNIIFYKIPELFELHQKFLGGLKEKNGPNVGKHFQNLAHEIWVYGAFLQNYSRAVDTVRKCCEVNAEFCEIAKNIRLKSNGPGGGNQEVSLETLLYSPVSRVQKNTEMIEDLLKSLPTGHPDEVALKSALKEFQSFLSEFKMIQPEQLFQGQDRSPRHLVKNSFIVELSEGHRKLRHIFLFNDVFVCAKYKSTGKTEKFTFELKWYIPVAECTVLEENSEPKESTVVNLVALRSQASTVRDQIKRQTSRDDPKKAKAEKHRKKLAELEAQLVLASPNLVFKVKGGNGRCYTFFLSSEYERSQWVDAIDALKTSQPSTSTQLSMAEMQNWLTSCRKHLKTNMGSYLLRTGRDENLLVGDLYILIQQLKGIQRPADLYICIEVDSYGHFFRKAKTKMICESVSPCWNQDFTIELEGAQNLRILLYEDHQRQGTLIRAKTTIELNKSWLTGQSTERKIDLQDYVLTVFTKFTPSEMTIRRVPTAKPSGLFGAKITQVCKREKRQIPFILTSCLREVERRGINEVGIYRVSGSTSDVSRLKKAFETNSYEAEQLLKEVDIHSVTGILKLYMRELPEALFTDELYPRFFEAFNQKDQEMKSRLLDQLFSTLPPINQHLIHSLLDHMVRINDHENHNKMSLHNIATVFGPTLLRPGAKNEGNGSGDLLAAGTVDVMAQAGILYFFLTRRAMALRKQSE